MGTLFEAVAAGDVEAVQRALDAGEDVNQSGDGGRTPLIQAAHDGRADLVALLLEADAEPSLLDAMQESAILKAGANGHDAVVRLLEPHAGPDEVDQARAFLRAFGQSHGPDRGPRDDLSRVKDTVARAGAKAADLLGNPEPQRRVERKDRADAHSGKKGLFGFGRKK